MSNPKKRDRSEEDGEPEEDFEEETLEEKGSKATKKSKGSVAKKQKTGDKEEKEAPKHPEGKVDIGNRKFVDVTDYKGRVGVNIREYYLHKESNTLKPGKGGIFLNPDNWAKLLEAAKDLSAQLEAKAKK